ncbi:apical junction component 1 homolog [Herpailurus yagouaroundi]|uniref:apical junction component 1 homolog n=1 Tax=Herpailurus yagouaroundi TaxID=1608482 RepID=UPI001AD66768|nr:apical junction component 1 homolog [Puma yagouaroundi]XP_040350485.1 apical junction component 1 homolog [Puma yagouaroundi]
MSAAAPEGPSTADRLPTFWGVCCVQQRLRGVARSCFSPGARSPSQRAGGRQRLPWARTHAGAHPCPHPTPAPVDRQAAVGSTGREEAWLDGAHHSAVWHPLRPEAAGVSAQHQPALSTSQVPSPPLALGPACRNPHHASLGQTTWPSHPSGRGPSPTLRLGHLLSPQGHCSPHPLPGSPKPGGTAGVLRVLCRCKWDQPGRGMQEGFLEEEAPGPSFPVLTWPTWLPPHSWLGLSLRLWYRELFKHRVPPEPQQAGGARTFHPHVADEEPEAQRVRGHKPTRWDHAQCSEPSSPHPPQPPAPAPGPLSASAPLSVSRSLPPRRQVPQARHGPGPAPEAA